MGRGGTRPYHRIAGRDAFHRVRTETFDFRVKNVFGLTLIRVKKKKRNSEEFRFDPKCESNF